MFSLYIFSRDLSVKMDYRKGAVARERTLPQPDKTWVGEDECLSVLRHAQRSAG
jgi:hypothetical protein